MANRFLTRMPRKFNRPFQQVLPRQLDVHGQKNKVGPLAHTHTDVHSKCVREPNVSAKTVTPLEEKVGADHHNLGLASGFLGQASKEQATKEKIDKLNFIKINNFVLQTTLSRK